MSVGKNATIAANDLVQYARANGIKILVSTPGGFVEDSTEGSVKRVANQLKELQWREMNRLESNEARNAKSQANRMAQIKQEAEQLEALVRLELEGKDRLKMNLQELILSLVYNDEIDAGPLLAKRSPVLHITGKKTSDKQQWFWKDGLVPMLASNSSLSFLSSNYQNAKHHVRNKKDTGNWGSVSLVRALHHMITHHGYEAKDGAVFHLLMFTSANQHYPAWHQFKVRGHRGSESIFPSCALYSRCSVDSVPCLIVKLELTSNIVNKNTRMTVTWMNGKEVNINAKDAGFEITNSKAISHALAPLEL